MSSEGDAVATSKPLRRPASRRWLVALVAVLPFTKAMPKDIICHDDIRRP